MEKLIQYRTNASLYDGAFDSVSGWSAAGMGYVIVSENGKLIVIDGGFGDDAENLLDILRRNSPDAVPEVDLWIITHPHVDHYGALREVSANEKLRDRVKVKRYFTGFLLNFSAREDRRRCLRHPATILMRS